MFLVVVVTGSTGVGKSDLGIYLAKKLDGEIINCDSTQIYKGMDIATNKVQDTEGVVHHLFNEKDLFEDYSVCEFQNDCRKIINDIISRGKVPILVGGTGLYINAALYDYKFEDKDRRYRRLCQDPRDGRHRLPRRRRGERQEAEYRHRFLPSGHPDRP